MPGRRSSEVHAKATGRELARARRDVGLTQHQLTERLNVNPSYIAAVETGRANPTLGQLAHLADTLGAHLQVTVTVPDRQPIRIPTASTDQPTP